MWPFERQDKLRTLLDELETLKRKVSGLEFQMLDVLDKTQRWMRRSVKRADRADQEVEAREAASNGTDGAVSGGTDPVSAMILKDRARGKAVRRTEE